MMPPSHSPIATPLDPSAKAARAWPRSSEAAVVYMRLLRAAVRRVLLGNGSELRALAPDELRARVTSIQRYGQGFVVGSSVLVGWLAGVFGIRIVMTSLGIVGLMIAIPFAIWSRQIRDLE